jgi:hypothetical protein
MRDRSENKKARAVILQFARASKCFAERTGNDY